MSNANLFPEASDESRRYELQQRAIRLLRPLLPHDAEDRVFKTVDRFNQLLRDQVRAETRLRLADETSKSLVPVRVEEGFVDPLAELLNAYPDPALWRLMISLPQMDAVLVGLKSIIDHWPLFQDWPKLPPAVHDGKPVLERSVDTIKALKAAAVMSEVRERLKEIHEDILGVYRYGDGKHEIALFWMPHALLAGILGVSIEDLAVVTLTHELAHAYTHLGRDIDGRGWDTNAFAQSDKFVKEGLAQFYSEVITRKLLARAPGAHETYNRLLSIQSGPYRAHREWLPNEKSRKSEIVRFAMLCARNLEKIDHHGWKELLNHTKEKLEQ